MKKYLLLLVLIMAVGFQAFAYADFPDVFMENDNRDAILYVQQQGIVQGYDDGLFRPDWYINRAEFTKILMKAVYNDQVEKAAQCNAVYVQGVASCGGRGGCGQTVWNNFEDCMLDKAFYEATTEEYNSLMRYAQCFPDVPQSEWFNKYVCFAKMKDVIKGYPDGTFKPGDNIDFSEAAKIIVNTYNKGTPIVEPATDKWYVPYINYLSNRKAIPVSLIAVDVALKRGEMAEIIYRLSLGLIGKTSLTTDEIGDYQYIEGYYNEIMAGHYDQAYAMKYQPTMSLDEFKKTYEGFPYMTVGDYSKTGSHTYSFYVTTFPNMGLHETDQRQEMYQVEMKVIDGKLKTISSDPVTKRVFETVAFDSNLKASIEWNNGVYEVYVIFNGVKTLADQEDSLGYISPFMKNLAFSKSGKYVTWEYYNWEFASVNVYDIANKVLKTNIGTEFYGFTNNETAYYFCSPAGMSGGEAMIYSLPGLDIKKNLVTEGTLVDSCGPFDSEKSELHYKMMDSKTGATHSYLYNFLTDKIMVQ